MITFYSITFSKQYVRFEFNTSDYFFIKITATLWAFHKLRSHMWHCTHMICFVKKLYNVKSHVFFKYKIDFELRVRRTYGLLPLLSWPTTCFWVRLRAGWPKLLGQIVSSLSLKISISWKLDEFMHTGKERNVNPYAFLVLFYICNIKLRIPSITWAKIQLIWNV